MDRPTSRQTLGKRRVTRHEPVDSATRKAAPYFFLFINGIIIVFPESIYEDILAETAFNVKPKMTKSDIFSQMPHNGTAGERIAIKMRGNLVTYIWRVYVTKSYFIFSEGAVSRKRPFFCPKATQELRRGQPPQRTSDSQKGRHTGSEGLKIGGSNR